MDTFHTNSIEKIKTHFYVQYCVIYRKIINKEDIEKLQKDLDRLGE